MFKKKTVFVVGAGGSVELNLPTGDTLKSKIGVKVDLRFSNGYDLDVGDPRVLGAIRLILEERKVFNVNPHCQAGRTIAAAMPQALSIDNFLHTHADNPLIVEVGKLGIAACIMEAERNSYIATKRDDDEINFGTHPDVWHNTFCKMLCEGIQKTKLDDLFANVSFITFNYDRCIEHYISNWLAGYMQISPDNAQALTGRLTIIHPYGQIGRLPWQQNNLTSVPFGAAVEAHTLPKVASHIKTFTEQVEQETVIDRIQEVLSGAEQVVFLGFSYGAMNLQLLHINEPGPTKTVRGTAFGMSKPNMDAITEELEYNCFSIKSNSMMGLRSFDNVTCYNLLNNYYRSLT
jgi:hypothetical protein